MKLIVAENGRLSIEDAANLSGFHIEPAAALGEGWAAVPAFAAIATAAEEKGHFWIDADAVAGLPAERADPEWRHAFWAMLRKVEPYGFADVAQRRIKSHVVRPVGH